MNRFTRYLIGLVAVALLLCMAPLIQAQTTGSYELGWFTIDGGGYAFSAGGGYQLGGTIGQLDAGTLSGGGYTLTGGFWSGGALAGPHRVYLPVVLR